MTDASSNNWPVLSHHMKMTLCQKVNSCPQLSVCLCLFNLVFRSRKNAGKSFLQMKMFMQNIQTQFRARPFHQVSIILQLPSQSKTRSRAPMQIVPYD